MFCGSGQLTPAEDTSSTVCTGLTNTAQSNGPGRVSLGLVPACATYLEARQDQRAGDTAGDMRSSGCCELGRGQAVPLALRLQGSALGLQSGHLTLWGCKVELMLLDPTKAHRPLRCLVTLEQNHR